MAVKTEAAGRSWTSPRASAWIALLAVVIYAGLGWEHQYVFDPQVMQKVANNAIAEGKQALSRNETELDAVFESVRVQLRDHYGKYMLENPPWLLNNAGGAMGSMQVLHFSLTEYVIIFGTAVGTEGHTGRFLADDYFTMLYGEQWAFDAGSHKKEVFRPGDQHLMPTGVSKQYRMPDSAWALEYARGNVISMLPFGILDTFTSTMDLVTLFGTIRVAAIGVVQSLAQGKV